MEKMAVARAALSRMAERTKDDGGKKLRPRDLRRKVWPEARLKRVLFHRTLRERHPRRFAAIVFGLWAAMYACIVIVYRDVI